MILPRYIASIASLDSDRVLSRLVRYDLRLSERPMVYALLERRMGQSDLILSLLRVGTPGARDRVEDILGRPIVLCPCVLLRWRINGAPPRVARTPRIARIVSNPRKPNTGAHARFAQAFRVGRTLEECRAYGATRRDVRSAVRRGWIEEVA